MILPAVIDANNGIATCACAAPWWWGETRTLMLMADAFGFELGVKTERKSLWTSETGVAFMLTLLAEAATAAVLQRSP